jgi:hypothetical protein
MKYLIEWWPREPVEENLKKGSEIEAERRKKGVLVGESETVFPIHFTLSDPRGIWVIEDDVKMSTLSKWFKAYGTVYNIKITPLISRAEFEKL